MRCYMQTHQTDTKTLAVAKSTTEYLISYPDFLSNLVMANSQPLDSSPYHTKADVYHVLHVHVTPINYIFCKLMLTPCRRCCDTWRKALSTPYLTDTHG